MYAAITNPTSDVYGYIPYVYLYICIQLLLSMTMFLCMYVYVYVYLCMRKLGGAHLPPDTSLGSLVALGGSSTRE